MPELLLRRKNGLYFLIDQGEEIPLTPEAYFMAVRDKISMVKVSGEQRNFPYSEMLSVLEDLLSDEDLQFQIQNERQANDY